VCPRVKWLFFAGDMDGRIGGGGVGYDGTHGGFGCGFGGTDGSRILEFADGLDLVICGTSFARRGPSR